MKGSTPLNEKLFSTLNVKMFTSISKSCELIKVLIKQPQEILSCQFYIVT